MRSTGGRPAPRSRRVGNTSANSFTPLCAAMRAAASRPASRSACPPSSSAVLPPAAQGLGDGLARWRRRPPRARAGGGGQGAPPSPQDTSAGRISVATWPGRPRAAAMASTASRQSSAVLLRGAHEAGRDIARHGLDVGLQLRVVRRVVGGMVADDVDHRHLALARVVQVGQAVAQAAAQVQERGGGLVGHARVAVGRAGGHALEQGQHGAHARLAVERGDEVHLAGAGVGEADVDAGVGQGFHQGLGAVHELLAIAGERIRWQRRRRAR